MLFKQSAWFGCKSALLAVAALGLMVLDYQGFNTQHLRMGLSAIVAPLQYTVSWPVEIFDWLTENISRQRDLIEENTKLRVRATMLQGRLQQILALQEENSQLRAMLQSTAERKENFTIAKILAVSTKPNMARLIIDKGLKDRVYQGQPVVDAYGVMGQIVQVGPLTSQVMLLTDVNSAIPIRVFRNGLHAVAVGVGTQQMLKLINLTDQADIQKEDVLVTSSLGLRYPEGYPVGKVTAVYQESGQPFIVVKAEPSARLHQSRQVLLVWPKAAENMQAVRSEIYTTLEQQSAYYEKHYTN